MQIAVIILAVIVGQVVLGVGLGRLLARGSAAYPAPAPLALAVEDGQLAA